MEAQKRLQKKGNAGKKKQQGHTTDIVFTKGGAIQVIPSMTKRLKAVTEPVIGLQFVWEYRSPTKAVPPHYQCKLCKVATLQNEMASHIIGWKHSFRFLKHSHAEKMSHNEEEAVQNPSIRTAVRMIAAEVEKTEGRGQLRVVIKEPNEVAVFQKMKSAQPSVSAPVPGALHSRGRLPGVPLGPQPLFPEFALRGGMMSGPDHFGGPDGMQPYPDGRNMNMDSDEFGMGPRNEGMGRLFPDELPMSNSRMMGWKDSDTNSTLSTLLTYLDTFRIDCEDDAQIVLKITQKLTDVLMAYRLRSISSGGEMNSTLPNSSSNANYSSRLPMNSGDFMPPDRLSSDRFANDRFPSDRFSNDRFPSDRFSNDRFPSDRFANDRFPGDRFANDRFASNRFPNDRPSSERFSSNISGASRFYN